MSNDLIVPVLSFNSIYYSYSNAKHPAVEEFSFQVQSTDIITVLGPNGSGKTTLLNLSLGLLQPQKGHIHLQGQSLAQLNRRHIGTQVALVPQSEQINFDYTVLDYLLIGRTPYLTLFQTPQDSDLVAVHQAMETIGISSLALKRVTELSGGELQLVLVARALAQQPALILLDEPTSHLDLANKSRLIHTLRKLQSQGITTLLTTHDPQMANRLATKVILMKAGKVYQAGVPSKVLTSTHLSSTYDVPVKVKHIDNQLLFIW